MFWQLSRPGGFIAVSAVVAVYATTSTGGTHYIEATDNRGFKHALNGGYPSLADAATAAEKLTQGFDPATLVP